MNQLSSFFPKVFILQKLKKVHLLRFANSTPFICIIFLMKGAVTSFALLGITSAATVVCCSTDTTANKLRFIIFALKVFTYTDGHFLHSRTYFQFVVARVADIHSRLRWRGFHLVPSSFELTTRPNVVAALLVS